MKVIVNGHSSEANEINVSIPQSSLIGPTLFLLYAKNWLVILNTSKNKLEMFHHQYHHQQTLNFQLS